MTQAEHADRFTGLASIYADYRPTYPAAVIEALAERAEHQAKSHDVPRTAIDVGCGTGIATLAVAQALPDWHIMANEPNVDMLSKAREFCSQRADIAFYDNPAESLPAADASCGLVLAAQALHWFDMDAFFQEAARVLAPGGLIAILYNNRQNEVSAVLGEIEALLEQLEPSYSRSYRDRDIPALLQSVDAFNNVERVRRIWLRPTSSDDLVDYFMSRSMLKPIAAKVGVSKLRHSIGDIADEHAHAGMIDIPFATELDIAVRV